MAGPYENMWRNRIRTGSGISIKPTHLWVSHPPSLVKVLSMASAGNREAGLRRLRESGVRVATGTRVVNVKEGGVIVLEGKEVRNEAQDTTASYPSFARSYAHLEAIGC